MRRSVRTSNGITEQGLPGRPEYRSGLVQSSERDRPNDRRKACEAYASRRFRDGRNADGLNFFDIICSRVGYKDVARSANKGKVFFEQGEGSEQGEGICAELIQNALHSHAARRRFF